MGGQCPHWGEKFTLGKEKVLVSKPLCRSAKQEKTFCKKNCQLRSTFNIIETSKQPYIWVLPKESLREHQVEIPRWQGNRGWIRAFIWATPRKVLIRDCEAREWIRQKPAHWGYSGPDTGQYKTEERPKVTVIRVIEYSLGFCRLSSHNAKKSQPRAMVNLVGAGFPCSE